VNETFSDYLYSLIKRALVLNIIEPLNVTPDDIYRSIYWSYDCDIIDYPISLDILIEDRSKSIIETTNSIDSLFQYLSIQWENKIPSAIEGLYSKLIIPGKENEEDEEEEETDEQKEPVFPEKELESIPF
jgi:hypothetical protein